MGLTASIVYLGCISLHYFIGRESAIKFFNQLLHGLDTNSMIKDNVGLVEAILGIVQIFLLGWLVGACIAGIYNFTLKK